VWVWAAACLLLLLRSARRLDGRTIDLLYTYFQALAPPVLMLWLWAHAVDGMAAAGVALDACFPASDRSALPAPRALLAAARCMACAGLGGLALCSALCAAGAYRAALLVPPVTYGVAAAAVLGPASPLARPARLLLLRTSARVVLPGILADVGWADFLLADMMTSLAKSTSDASRAVCLMLHGARAHMRLPDAAF
jgi:EXS family